MNSEQTKMAAVIVLSIIGFVIFVWPREGKVNRSVVIGADYKPSEERLKMGGAGTYGQGDYVIGEEREKAAAEAAAAKRAAAAKKAATPKP